MFAAKAQFGIGTFGAMAGNKARKLVPSIYKANKRNFLIILAPVAMLLTSFMPISQKDDNKGADASDLGVTTLVIDPGHGGKDPGAIGHSDVQEKDVVLAVSLKLGEYVKEHFPDVEVIYTRKTDKFVELYERAKIANRNQADLFISVHANVAGGSSAHGCETYVLGLHRTKANLEVAKQENSAILMEDDYKTHYENFDPRDPESYIALELMQSEYLEQSLHYAAFTQEQFRERVGRRDRGVKQAGFLVLYKTTMPSVLVELGFLSNPSEEKFLNSEDGQAYMASAMFRSFRDYKETIESVGKSMEAQEKKRDSLKQATLKTDVDSMVPADSGVVFKVQIAASSTPVPLEPANFKGLSGVDEYISDGIHKYTVGHATAYEDAQNTQEKAREAGYSGAFIIAFRNGERIDLQQALTQVKNR